LLSGVADAVARAGDIEGAAESNKIRSVIRMIASS
jgi:hypothetical protein